MPKLDKKPLLNQNPFCDRWKIRLKKPMLIDARRGLLYFIFSTFPANVNPDLHCLQATIPWSRSNSNITKLFNSLSKRQVSTNFLPDLFRKRFYMAWRLHFLMFYWFLNILFYLSIFMLSIFDTYLYSCFNIFIKENHHSSRD